MTGRDLPRRLRSWIARRAGRGAGRLRLAAGGDGRGGRPFAEFAGVLDGRHLWLAVADAGPDDTLGLRLPDGSVTALEVSHEPAAPSAPAVLAARVDLHDLVQQAPWRDRVTADELRLVPVLVGSRGAVEAVWTPAGSLAGRERRPDSVAPGLRPRLVRAEDGTLALLLAVTTRGARAVALAERPGAVTVHVESPDHVISARVLGAGEPPGTVARLDVAPHQTGVLVTVPRDVELPPGELCPLVLETADGHRPVHRVEDDVRDARPAVRMPGVVSAGGTSLLRLAWDREGRLALEREDLDPQAQEDVGDDADDADNAEVPGGRSVRQDRPPSSRSGSGFTWRRRS